MKKLLPLILILILIFAFSSCRGEVTFAETSGTSEDTVPETSALTETEPSVDTEEVTDTAAPDTETEPPAEITTPYEMFVMLNEVCSSNKTIFADKKGETPNWIELYNSSYKSVNLAGYGISDDPDEPFKYTFTNYLIESGSYVILLATGKASYSSGVISLPFELSREGGEIILTSPEGLSDTLSYPELHDDETYGRVTDGGILATHLTPTPLSTNDSAVTLIRVPRPKFSTEGGFYSEQIEIFMEIPEDCRVYYTLDGSTPSESDDLYSEPIVISAESGTNVVRAVSVDAKGHKSDVTTCTYFLLSEEEAYSFENTAILSVCADADIETDEQNRKSHVEFFDGEHLFAFCQDADIVNYGDDLRSGFDLLAVSEYGKTEFEYDIFGVGAGCKSFSVSALSGDFSEIKQILATSLVSRAELSSPSMRGCALFLNGEYQGFYMMSESLWGDYFERNYGVSIENVAIMGSDADTDLFAELRELIINEDLALPENYEKLCGMIDIESYIDYICFNIIIEKRDLLESDSVLWRVREAEEGNPYADGRWRFVIDNSENSMEKALHYESALEQLMNDSLIFRRVYENEQFRSVFRETLFNMLTSCFAPEAIETRLALIEQDFDRQMQTDEEIYHVYTRVLEEIKEFWQSRAEELAAFAE